MKKVKRKEKPFLYKAHHFCSYNRGAIETMSTQCGCFHCLRTFESKDIKEWTDNNETALCPYCGIDSVLGNKNPFCEDMDFSTGKFLKEMQVCWFEYLQNNT